MLEPPDLMLEPPDLDTTALAEELARSYALSVAALDFLALGADPNTAVFRAIDFDRRAYFVKLRGSFDPVSVTLPDLLRKRGSVNVIAPLKTHTGALACDFDRFTLILYPYVDGRDPYVDGRDAWETGLTETQWHALGRALKSLHTLTPPPDLAARIRRETYAPLWRDRTRAFLGRVEHETWAERVAVQAAELLRDRRDVIQNLVDRAERLATTLQEQPREAVVCHSDIHAGNVLLDAEGVLHVVECSMSSTGMIRSWRPRSAT